MIGLNEMYILGHESSAQNTKQNNIQQNKKFDEVWFRV